MNTYNENLQGTVIDTLAGIYQQEQELKSEQIAAQYTLYLAQGTEITERDKLAATKDTADQWGYINDQAVINDNQMFNGLSSATSAAKIVAASITNTAAAASNVQIAANAISLLAADIGAALNVATASLYNTDTFNRIVQANNFINDVSNESSRIAKNAMNASANTSEVIATEVLTLAKGCKTKVGNVLKATQSELTKFSNLYIDDWNSVNDASRMERQAEGSLEDADRALRAMRQSYFNANTQLNMGLTIHVVSGFEIQVAFQGLASPLPTFTAEPASKTTIPDANPKYYLALVPTQSAASFSIEQAMQLFQQSTDAGSAESGFLAVSPVGASGIANPPVLLTVDALADPVEAGQSYVAYIFTELSLPYKQYINNFADLLSAPSKPFTPATKLPAVQNVVFVNDEKPDAGHIRWSHMQFQAVPLALSAEQAAQAAAADAQQASLTSAAASQAVTAAIEASTNIASSASAAAAATQRAQSAANTAASDAHAEAAASLTAQTAATAAGTANVVVAATNVAFVAASVANNAAAAVNAAWQNLSSAKDALAAASPSGDAKAKGKTGPNAEANSAKAQSAREALSSAAANLLPAVNAADVAANYASVAANSAAVLVTLYDPLNAPRCEPEVRKLAIALAVSNAAVAAAGAAASAAAIATDNAASAAAATARGSSTASAANSAATAASSAAQISDAAANAVTIAQAAVTAASENLTQSQIQQASKVLVDALAIVSAPPVAPITPATPARSANATHSIDPALCAAILSAANLATVAATDAHNAVTVTSGVNQSLATGANSSDGVQEASESIQTAISTLVKALDGLATQTATNAGTAAKAATIANQQATTTASHAKAAATKAANSAAAALVATQAATSANELAATAINQADVASKAANEATALANAAATAAAASAALAAASAEAGPVGEGTTMAADAIGGADYEFRCILVRVNDAPNLNLKLAEENQYIPPIYFNLNIAQQVAAANYVVARRQAGNSADANHGTTFTNPVWQVDFDATVTDNYGNLLIPGCKYYPYVLTAATGDQNEQDALTNVLTNQFDAHVICQKVVANTAKK